MWNELFWTVAGLWNIIMALLLWSLVYSKDKKARKDDAARCIYLAFGIGYVAIGFIDWMWYLMIIGILIKITAVLEFFTTIFNMRRNFAPDARTWFVVGEFFWAVGFIFAFLEKMSTIKLSS